VTSIKSHIIKLSFKLKGALQVGRELVKNWLKLLVSPATKEKYVMLSTTDTIGCIVHGVLCWNKNRQMDPQH
jgi:hypothetical protein